MLALLTLLVLAINGGLFVGAILHSFKRMSHFDEALDVYRNFWA